MKSSPRSATSWSVLGIPVLFLGSLFERDEVKDLLAFLSILVDRRAMGLTRIASGPEFTLSLRDLGVVLNYLRANEDRSALLG